MIELLERHLKRLSRAQAEGIHVRFQWHDPAVQQVGRAHLLATEVVDQEHPAVGLHLQRRFVEAGYRIDGAGRGCPVRARRPPLPPVAGNYAQRGSTVRPRLIGGVPRGASSASCTWMIWLLTVTA